jgi:ATP-dependent Clp protease adapter protein ClpS
MSLSIAAIEKHQVTLSELIETWLKDNPEEAVTGPVSDTKLKPPERGDASTPKQVVTVALRTRPFLESETADGKQILNGVHARGTKMIVHVPSAKVCTGVFWRLKTDTDL